MNGGGVYLLPVPIYVYATHIVYLLALTRKIINHSSISEGLGVNTLTRACA